MSAHSYQYPIKTHPDGVSTFADLEVRQIEGETEQTINLTGLRAGLERHKNRPADERLWEICRLDRGATIRDAIVASMQSARALEFGAINIFGGHAQISKVFDTFGIIPQGELELAAASTDIVTVFEASSFAQEISDQIQRRLDDFILIDSTDSWAIVFFHSGAVCMLDRRELADGL